MIFSMVIIRLVSPLTECVLQIVQIILSAPKNVSRANRIDLATFSAAVKCATVALKNLCLKSEQFYSYNHSGSGRYLVNVEN